MPRMDKLSKYATAVYRDSETQRLQVFYHSTCIVEAYPDRINLRTGGWKTVTTKRKMNQAARQFGLDYSVHQHKHEWFVTLPNGHVRPFDGDEVLILRN